MSNEPLRFTLTQPSLYLRSQQLFGFLLAPQPVYKFLEVLAWRYSWGGVLVMAVKYDTVLHQSEGMGKIAIPFFYISPDHVGDHLNDPELRNRFLF